MKLSTLITIKEVLEGEISGASKEIKTRHDTLTKLRDELDKLGDELPFPELKDGYSELKTLAERVEVEYKTLLDTHSKLKIAYQDIITHDFN